MGDYDPRIVSLYDQDNPDGPDHDFYRDRADHLAPRTIIDLGCGTGMLTVTLRLPERTVVGIDPSQSMLDVATQRPGGQGVRWVRGDASSIAHGCADLMVMTGNVAQHIVGEAWSAALRDVYAGLRSRGRLIFESRNPAARAWEQWATEARNTRETALGNVTEWMEVEPMTQDGHVSFVSHNIFEWSGERLVERQTLAFRNEDRIRSDLADTGFHIEEVWGGWDYESLGAGSTLMVFQAQRLSLEPPAHWSNQARRCIDDVRVTARLLSTA